MSSTKNSSPDVLLSERVAKAVEMRDSAHKASIEYQTEVKLAAAAAAASREEALKEHGVATLDELSSKMKTIYTEDLAEVEKFEKEVAAYVAEIEKAKAILAEVRSL